jgi:hypothetical protein
MSNYTKSTNFASKDNLSPGNPLKIVKGAEIDTEFNNIQTAVATKTDNASANITGGSITGITDLAVADGGTGASTATAALNNLLPTQTGNANKYLQTDGTNATWDAVSLSTSDITGTLPVANGGTGVTSSTGTGNVVLSNSPTLVTPALGTPASGTATNLTGLPISTGVSGLGTGVATFLGTPSSANLASAVSDETGSGALVFANSPTLVTPALGTPSALVGTNITGTASGLTAGNVTTNANLTGAVTSVGNATSLGSFSSSNLAGALTDETGSGSAVFATSPTLVTPILGTPTSATLTNATGLPLSTGVTGQLPVANGGTGTATPSIVAGSNVTVTGTWPNQTIAASSGGTPGGSNTQVQYNNAGAFGGITGATTDGTALTLVAPVLGTPASATLTNATGLPLSTGVTGTLPVANGGTGQTSYTDGQLLIGNSTGNTLTKATLTAGSGVTITNGNGAITIAAASGSGDVVGPASSTANGVALFDGTTGKLLKDSSATDGLIHGLTLGRGAGAVSTNTVLGASAFQANTTGSNSVVVGNQAGYTNSTGIQNVFIGNQAGYFATGRDSTFVGTGAGGAITSGTNNTIIGQYDGNGDGLDIRTASNYAVISDGDGNRLLSTANGYSLALDGGAVPQTGTGITFPATQSASSDANTLDDYEEGTWTPEMSFGNDTTGITYSTQVGTYEKIGRQVTLRCQVTFTNNGSGSGIAKLSGFPFTLLAASNAAAAFSIFTDVTLSGTYYASAVPQASSTFAYFRMSDAYMTETQFTNTANFTFMTSYNV